MLTCGFERHHILPERRAGEHAVGGQLHRLGLCFFKVKRVQTARQEQTLAGYGQTVLAAFGDVEKTLDA